MTMGRRIKELRKACGLTQQELAEGIITRSYISQIEKGLITPSYDTLNKLAPRLNCTVEGLLKAPENHELLLADWKKVLANTSNLVQSGEFDKARTILSRAGIEQTSIDQYDRGTLAWVQAEIAIQQGDYSLGYEQAAESARWFAAGGSVSEQVRSGLTTVRALIKLHDIDAAHQLIMETYETSLLYGIGGLQKAEVLRTLADVLINLGEYRSALHHLKKASSVYNHAFKGSIPVIVENLIDECELFIGAREGDEETGDAESLRDISA